MSSDSFSKFARDINTDDALRTALTEQFGDLSQDIPADELIDFASGRGYDFSVEEASDELSDAALEGVAGGLSLGQVDTTFEEVKVTYIKIDPFNSTFNFYMKY